MSGSKNLPQSRLEVPAEIDEQAFFTLGDGTRTLAGHADLEAAVPNEEKPHLQELERYWVNKPFAFVVIYRHIAQQEHRYVLVEPSLSDTERALVDFFRRQTQTQHRLRDSLDRRLADRPRRGRPRRDNPADAPLQPAVG